MRPLRIAYIGQKGIPARWGGVETHVDALATRLAARGHHVTAYVRPWYTDRSQTEHDGVRLIHRPTIRGKHLDAAVHSFLSSLHAMGDGYDIVHYHAVGPSLFAWVPRMRRVPVVATIHALDFQRRKWGFGARLALRTGERCALVFAQRTIVVSRTLAAHYAEQGRTTHYVPNGVVVGKPAAPDRIRTRLNLRGDDYLLSLGRWAPEKGVRELVATFVGLAPEGIKLVVAGDVDQLPRYRRAVVEAAGGSDAVLFPGWVSAEEKAELYTNARAFVTPSRLEGLPIALLEAMSYGVPCLASDIPPHREVLGPIDSGLLFPAGDPSAVRQWLEALLAMPREERRDIGQRARAHVARSYDWDRVADQHEALYHDLLRDR